MISSVCLIHYHEIGLKGKNRSYFENTLKKNLLFALSDLPVSRVSKISGHLLVDIDDESYADIIFARIKKIPGIARCSFGWRTSRDETEYLPQALHALASAGGFETFKVAARRSNTDYHLNSMELNQQVGAYLCEHFPDKTVKMKNPDVTVHVNVVQGSVYIYAQTEPGVGGLPCGTAGLVVSLISSGFDSPVATWQMMRRGALVVPLHFSGRPQTSDESEYLVQDICKVLSHTGGLLRLYVAPFGDFQKEIALAVPTQLRVIMYRRVMLLVAQKLAERLGAKALVTGESLGQVASQTLDNIVAVNEVATMPILRPLIGSDKNEIIERAEQIGTAELSAQTVSDCCTLFMPRNPETHAKLDMVHEAWAQLRVPEMVDEIVDSLESYDFPCPFHL